MSEDEAYQRGLADGRAEARALLGRIEAVRSAVHEPGPMPNFHRRVADRHRREWPTLWRALDSLVGRLQ